MSDIDRICEGLPPEAREKWLSEMVLVKIVTICDEEYVVWVKGPCEYEVERLADLKKSEAEWWNNY